MKVTLDLNWDDDLEKNNVIPQMEQDHLAWWHLAVTALTAVVCTNAVALVEAS